MAHRFTNLKESALLLRGLFISILIVNSLANFFPVKAQTVSKQIIVDQFGWRVNSKKSIIFSDPITGQNGSVSYTPGTQFQIRKKSDNSVVFTGNVVAWNGGNTHGDSGDKIWHGDFSGLTTPGTYYVVDPTRNVRSYDFDIKNDVYSPVLKTSVKTFYYQRSGTAISATHGGNWNHPAAHGQDAIALLYTTSAQTGTARNVTGGWYDAGDYNKYIPFLGGTVWDLLVAYELRPAAFPDNTVIPESGNGIPDLLDELKWEFDWMLKMQQSNGGVNNRVAVTSYENGTDNPATDTQPRYYTNVTTWSTATFAALTAHAARTYQSVNPAYATALRTASEKAWTYLEANASMSPASGTDGAAMAAADAGSNANADRRLRIYAAAELFRTTGTANYKTYFESNYKNINATSENGFHPFSNGNLDASLCWDLNRAYFVYCQTPNATPTIVAELKTRFLNAMDWNIEPAHNSKNDPYLGFMWSGHYTWGSNQLKMKWAQLAILSAELGINSAKTALYREIAEEYLHYLHGRNPLSWLYLSNMGAKGANLGGDNSVMEIYHSWYRDGSSKYDGTSSQFGPAPGFVAGGANQYYSGTATPPKSEPPMKAYRDWNTVWPDASWEVTEPAIYYQAAYTFVVAYFSENSSSPPPTVTASSNSPVCAGQSLNLLASSGGTGAVYSWRGPNSFTSTQQNPTITTVSTTATGSYTLTVTPAGGPSKTATTSVTVNAIPTVVAGSNSPVVAGQTLNLTASNAGTGATYAWRGPNNFTSTQQNPAIANVTTAASGSYTLTVGLNACTKTATTSTTVTGSTATTYLIYEDALNGNWADWSWSTTRNFGNTSPVQSGSKSLSVKYDAGWAGLYLHANTPVSLAGLTHLKFWLHGGTNTGQQIRIILNGGGSYYTATSTADQWKLVTIPLSTFNNPTSLSDIYFQEATGSARPVCYLDKIYLASSANGREGVFVENRADADVLVFPNPIDNGKPEVTLQFVGFGVHETVQTTLSDVQGRAIQAQSFQLNGTEKRLSLPKLSAGWYFIQIMGENKQFVRKVLVK